MVETGMLAEKTIQRKQNKLSSSGLRCGLFQVSSTEYWIAKCLAWEYDNASMDASFFSVLIERKGGSEWNQTPVTQLSCTGDYCRRLPVHVPGSESEWGNKTELAAACPFLSQGPSSILDPGRATTTLVLPLRRRGGGLGFTPHFHRLRWDIVLYFDLHVLGFQSGRVQLLQEIWHTYWERWECEQADKPAVGSKFLHGEAYPSLMYREWKQLITSENLWKGMWIRPLKS